MNTIESYYRFINSIIYGSYSSTLEEGAQIKIYDFTLKDDVSMARELMARFESVEIPYDLRKTDCIENLLQAKAISETEDYSRIAEVSSLLSQVVLYIKNHFDVNSTTVELETKKDLMEHISCPFCGMHIVDYYEDGEIPDDMDEDAKYEMEQGGYDDATGFCEHLALFSEGQGAEIKGKWSPKLIEKIGRKLIKMGMIDDADESEANEYEFDDLPTQVLEGIGNYSLEDISNILGEGYQVQFDGGYYVERGMGIQGSGGPTYDLLFIKKIPKGKK